jgi:hypothetical protein
MTVLYDFIQIVGYASFCRHVGGELRKMNWNAFNEYLSWPEKRPAEAARSPGDGSFGATSHESPDSSCPWLSV